MWNSSSCLLTDSSSSWWKKFQSWDHCEACQSHLRGLRLPHSDPLDQEVVLDPGHPPGQPGQLLLPRGEGGQAGSQLARHYTQGPGQGEGMKASPPSPAYFGQRRPDRVIPLLLEH